MENEDIYKEANKRVQAKKGFFYHLIAYVFVIGMFYTLMHFENNGEILPVIFVALSWGIGLASHYFKTFGTQHLDVLGINPNWEEEALEKEIEKLERKRERKIRKEKDLLNEAEGLALKEIEKRPLEDDFD